MIRLKSLFEGIQFNGLYTGEPSLFIELTTSIDGYLILEDNLLTLIKAYKAPLSNFKPAHIVFLNASDDQIDNLEFRKLIDKLLEDSIVTAETIGQNKSLTLKLLARHSKGHVITEPVKDELTDDYKLKSKYTNDLILTFPEYDRDSLKIKYDRLYIRPPSLTFQMSAVTMGALVSELQTLGGVLCPINDRLKSKCLKRINLNEY